MYHFLRKYYHDDSIMTSSNAFILCDQLAGLNALDFRYFNHTNLNLKKKSSKF